MVSAAHFSFMGICRNTTFEVLYCNLFSGISRWYHYHKSEVNSMKAEKKEINIQIGKRLQTARENGSPKFSGVSQSFLGAISRDRR